jgi:hypothetical protein
MDPTLRMIPSCYLADLPPEADLTPSLIQEAWRALQRNRDRYLVHQTTTSVLQDLEAAAAKWLAPDSRYLQLALETPAAGFPAPTLAAGLGQVFGSITIEGLEAWIEQDLGHPNRLDAFCASGPERGSHRRSKAIGPATLGHITAGNLPIAGILSLASGVVVRSAQFVKCATGASLIPRLFAHSLREVNPQLGNCLEIAEWPRHRADLHQVFIEGADCVTIAGTDESISALRATLPAITRLIAYGHRVSLAFVAREMLEPNHIATLALRIAQDVCAWNQQGCLSPHVVYAEHGGTVNPEVLAASLAAALETLEASHPRGPLPEAEAATIRSRRAFYEVRAAASPTTRLWTSSQSTAWTVVYEADPQFQTSCLNRFVYVKAVPTLEIALQGADPIRRHVSTVALAAPPARSPELARRLAEWGTTRICPVGCMQNPPLLWRHDGRPALGELVRWVDWEQAEPDGFSPPCQVSQP